ncbi:MAG: ABC transporter substrate-binding protein [Alphaproteobacteria bacterium]
MKKARLGLICTFSALLLWGQEMIGPARAETGVTDGEIRIGMWTSLSGPLSLLGQSEKDGVGVWAKEVNDRGGINGRKIVLIAYDDAASPQEAQTAVRRLIDQDQVFMLIAGSSSGSTLPVRQVISRDKVPFVSSYSSNVNLMSPFSRYIFRIYANEDYQADGIIEWMMTREKIAKPAIIYNSNDYGVGGYNIFVQRLKDKYNMAPVAAERYNPGDQDFTAQLLRIKGAHPDGLLIYAFAAEAGIIVRQAKEQGLDVKLFGGGATGTPLLIKAAGPASAGFISVFTVPEIPENSKAPAVIKYKDELKSWFHPDGYPPGRPSEYDMAAYAAGKVTEAALEKVGKNVTREGFIDALETLKDFATGTTFPVTFTKESHEGTTHVSVIRVTPDLHWETDPDYVGK